MHVMPCSPHPGCRRPSSALWVAFTGKATPLVIALFGSKSPASRTWARELWNQHWNTSVRLNRSLRRSASRPTACWVVIDTERLSACLPSATTVAGNAYIRITEMRK